MMHQRKSKRIILLIFLLILVGSINNLKLNALKISGVESVKISGLNSIENQIISDKINNLNLENIFFLNRIEISKILNSNSLIESYKVFKNYPSSLNIQIEKTKFLAKINKDSKIYLIGSNGKLSNIHYSTQKFPYIFGNPEIKKFLDFKKIIDQSLIDYSKIENLYFFQSNRWDLKLKNNILIKLPEGSTEYILNDISKFLNESNFKNLKIIDARIKNQIIINE